MSIDKYLKGKEFVTEKKFQRKQGGSGGPVHEDVKSRILTPINKAIKWLDGFDQGGRANDIKTFDQYGKGKPLGKAPCTKLWVEKEKDGAFVGYQWTPKYGNTNVYLREDDCKNTNYINGGSNQGELVESMKAIRDVLNEIPNDDFGVWASIGTYLRNDDGTISLDGNKKLVKKGTDNKPINTIQFITTKTRN